jgi:hypothetical protein
MMASTVLLFAKSISNPFGNVCLGCGLCH